MRVTPQASGRSHGVSRPAAAYFGIREQLQQFIRLLEEASLELRYMDRRPPDWLGKILLIAAMFLLCAFFLKRSHIWQMWGNP